MKKVNPKKMAKKKRPGAPPKRRAGAAKKTARRDERLFADGHLSEAVATVELAYTLTSPLLGAIEGLLSLAAQILNSHEASVIIRDEKRGGLKFLVATGEFADDLKKMRIPPGKGIAGFVYTTGQPVAVADVSQDQSFYAEVDLATGHSTRTILATPLRAREETIGVLEFVNRAGLTPDEPFSPDEMDRAALFADVIALLVDAHEQANLIESFLNHALEGVTKGETQGDLHRWLTRARAAPAHRELLSLAVTLRDLAARGEEERHLCLDVLSALSRWTQKRSGPGGDFFAA